MNPTLEESLHSYSFLIIGVASFFLLVLTLLAMKFKKSSHHVKLLLFSAMIAAIILPTIFLSVSTVVVNVRSVSKGPVHWHADIEVWACGKEIELKDPKGLSNKIGTATLHEHKDKRIHLEGVVGKHGDASLGKFFNVIGGQLTSFSLIVPTVNGDQSYIQGQTCPDGTVGEVQTFVYKTENGMYTQQKLPTPEEYSISPYSQVPEGDCVIVEFDAPKDKTDKLCRSYKVAEEIGKVKKGGY